MREFKRRLMVLIVGASLLVPQHAHAYIYPTFDQNRYSSILNQIQTISSQIKKWSEMIGTVREQIDTLQNVSSAIRDLKGVINQSVRGLASQIAAELGIDKMLEPVHAIQELVGDTQALIRDAKELPDLAKQRLAEIGYSIQDVQQFLRNGLVYDTFNRLGVEEWKEVAKDPWVAFKNGSVGMAISRSEGYLSDENRGSAWSSYMASLSDQQKAQLGPLIGGAYAANLAGTWFEDMTQRTKSVVDMRNVGNKLTEVIENTNISRSSGKEAASNVLKDLKALSTTKAWRQKVKASVSVNAAGAQHVLTTNEATRLKLENEENEAESTADEAKAITIAP